MMRNPDPSSPYPAASSLRLGELLGALSHALDMTEGQPKGHCVRCCWIGLEVADALALPRQQREDLYFALLMKDLGCSSNAARICQLYLTDDLSFKRDFKTVRGTRKGIRFLTSNTAVQSSMMKRMKTLGHVLSNNDAIAQELIQTRCDRGAQIARQMRFSEEVAQAIACLDEHWDGAGRPMGLKGDTIPLMARIALMAQVTDVFTLEFGAEAAAKELEARAGNWFDPDLVPVFTDLIRRPGFAEDLTAPAREEDVFARVPAKHTLSLDEDYLDEISYAFALVIDAKSPFTHGHSERVACYTGMICQELGHAPAHRRWMVRAALLHDIGKLGISNTILDKPGKLTDEEFIQIKRHPVLGHEVLSRIAAFKELADVASAHHERLDGKGYPHGVGADQLSRDMRILAVADIFDALTADRPYRAAMPLEKAYAIMDDIAGSAIDADCYAALQQAICRSGWPAPQLTLDSTAGPAKDQDKHSA